MESLQLAQMLADLSDLNAAVRLFTRAPATVAKSQARWNPNVSRNPKPQSLW